MDKNLEIRNLTIGALNSIVQTLEIDDSWKKVMDHIPKDPSGNNFERKYNSDHVRLIQQHAIDTRRKCTEVLFDEWGTSGKKRPTLKILLDVLRNAQIYRAADELAQMLQEPLPDRPQHGPAKSITTNISVYLNGRSMEQSSEIPTFLEDRSYLNPAVHNGTTKEMKDETGVNMMQLNVHNTDAGTSFGKRTTARVGSGNNIENVNQAPGLYTLNTDEMPDLSLLQESTPDSRQNVESGSEMSPHSSSSSNTSSVPHMSDIDLYNVIDKGVLDNPNLIQFQYNDLQAITKNFSEVRIETLYGPLGLIGKGGFGEVFAGIHNKYGNLAVKKVRCLFQLDCDPRVAIKVFNNEVVSLSHLKHTNIVPILGFSLNGPVPCIVCKYIEGGNLEQKLAEKVLNAKQRMDIIIGTAEGLQYIHNAKKPSDPNSPSDENQAFYLHGDVKSANILLTNDCIPKLCDFGLATQLDTTYLISSMMGTSAYMPYEAFSGTITRKSDIYSYGIVLLELLTGLKALVSNKGGGKLNITTYIEENVVNGLITSLLDSVVANWDKAQNIYNLAQLCLENNRNRRPSIDEVCQMLYKINLGEA